MRVCFVIEQGYDLLLRGGGASVGGAEKQQVLLARALRRLGHQVNFIAASDLEQERMLETKYGTVHTIATPAPSRSRPTIRGRALVGYYSRVLGAARAAAADVYYFRAASGALLPLAAWCRVSGAACVYAAANDGDAHLRAGDRDMPLRGWRRLPYLAGLRLAIGALAQHESQARAFARLGIHSVVVPNAIDLDAVGPARVAAPASDVVAIGRIHAQKRPELIVELARRLPHLRFAIVGGGQGESVERFRSAMAGVSNLQWIGHVPPEAVDAYLSPSVALVNTSKSEGFPNAFLEAWARAVPVVSLTVDPGGIMSSNDLGEPSGTIDRMAARIDDLARSPERRAALGRRSRAYVEREHALDIVGERLVRAIRELRQPLWQSRAPCVS